MSARVLVVDDKEANRRLMKAKLEAKYYTVTLAKDGYEALQAVKDEPPQIILLDVMMPGMDGYEVCRRLKEDTATRHIPIVMLTALSDGDDRVRGLDAGADDFLSKPVDDFALFGRLEALSRYHLVASELQRRQGQTAEVGAVTDEERFRVDQPANILIIDGNARGMERLRRDLTAAGHEVFSWQDRQSDPRLAEKRVDLIFLSISNQSFDPLRLCAHIAASDTTSDLPLIVNCNQQDQQIALEALKLGASDIIVGPADRQELLARVRTQLRRSRYIEILRQRVDRGLELSVIDQLTGLNNRRYMLDQLHQWMHRSAVDSIPLSIAAFDIDFFKRVNDEHGHEAGDTVLRQVAERIRMNIRPKDLACRPGGEEFVIVLPETNGELALRGAERIRRAIAAAPFRLPRTGVELSVTISAGVSSFDGEDDTVADLLHRADQALYRAKQLGRNRIESLAA